VRDTEFAQAKHCCECCKGEDDRMLLTELFNAAAHIIAEGKNSQAAEAFLDGWFKRKAPQLGMPVL
jgi:hypothetical protein